MDRYQKMYFEFYQNNWFPHKSYFLWALFLSLSKTSLLFMDFFFENNNNIFLSNVNHKKYVLFIIFLFIKLFDEKKYLVEQKKFPKSYLSS